VLWCWGWPLSQKRNLDAGRVAKGTTSAPARDRARLLELQKHLKCQVVTMSMGMRADDCEPGQHYEGYFSRRSVRGLKELLGKEEAVQYLLLDYFRFPTTYMFDAFLPFLKEMRPALLQAKIISDKTTIIMPNLTRLFDEVPLPPSTWKLAPLQPSDNPLYAVTDAASVRPSLGAYVNADNMRQLDPKAPFVQLSVVAK
jgi:hypothetical protein